MYTSSFYPLIMAAVFIVLAGVFVLDYALSLRDAEKRKRQAAFFKRYINAIIFTVAFLVFFLLNNHKSIYYNNYSYLCEAWLDGRLYVVNFPTWLESVEFGGLTYMHFAPGAALLHLPFVALFGVNGFNTAWLSYLLGASNAVLFYNVFTNLRVGKTMRSRLWCTAFAVFGTVHCFLSAIGHSWFIGHTSTLFYLLIAMLFITDRRERKYKWLFPFLAGLFYGLSVTCRISNLLSGLFFLGYVLFYKDKRDWLVCCIAFVCGAAIPGGLYMLMNYLRYGTIMDISYNLTHLKDYYRDMYNYMQTLPTKSEQLAYLRAAEREVGGPQQLQFVKHNLYSIFLMPPNFSSSYPYIIPSQSGLAVTICSPALFYAVLAPWKKRLKLCLTLIVTAVICSVPFLLNYGNGMAQFGMRYAMDFLPYLIILACMGLSRCKRPLVGRIIILLSIFVNIWGPVYWNCFYLG
ncbi:MAG TPA: hypothetical protein P5116_03790 [Eubacteriales bacterium]|nr:hypothetical protein [Eubacteriales bacterium]